MDQDQKDLLRILQSRPVSSLSPEERKSLIFLLDLMKTEGQDTTFRAESEQIQEGIQKETTEGFVRALEGKEPVPFEKNLENAGVQRGSILRRNGGENTPAMIEAEGVKEVIDAMHKPTRDEALLHSHIEKFATSPMGEMETIEGDANSLLERLVYKYSELWNDPVVAELYLGQRPRHAEKAEPFGKGGAA